MKWYTLSSAEALQQLEARAGGLGSAEAVERLAQYGFNALPERGRRSWLALALSQFGDFMVMVLLAAALVSGLIGDPEDTIAILVIVLLNALVGAVQERRADNAIAAMRRMAAPDARVLRDEVVATLEAGQLVPGDVVLLEAGNVVPADLRLLAVEDMSTDESALTGESVPVSKQVEVIDEECHSPGDQRNMAFRGTLVTQGSATGLVVATGLATEMGRIAELLQLEPKLKTPLQQRLTRFGRYLALAVLAICAIVFVAGLLQGQPTLLMFLTAVSLAVAAIPEALPAVITVSLALGARKLARHNALIRNLPAVETLGSVTCICADKTGTLTQNRMTVELYYYGGNRQRQLSEQGVAAELGSAMALNNDVASQGQELVGEPTELALCEAAEAAGFGKERLLQDLPREATLAFDSGRKRMSTLHRNPAGVVAYVKGAPEQLLPLCRQAYDQGDSTWSTDALLAEAESMAGEGYRVLAFARREFDALPKNLGADVVEQQLDFLGLVALIDPPDRRSHRR